MTKVINDSLWTARRERAPLVWKVEKIDVKPQGEVRQVFVGVREQTEQKESDPALDFSIAA